MLPRLGLYVPVGVDMSAVLDAEIARYNAVEYLRLLSGLSAVRDAEPEAFDREVKSTNRDPQGILRGFQIRQLVKLLLQSGAPWDSGVVPHTRDIIMHCEWIQNILCQADRGFLGDAPGDAMALLWRMAYQQFKDLEGNRDLLRSLIIYRRLALQASERHGYPLMARFKDVTGIDLDEFWFLSMALYGWCLDNRGKSITPEVFSRSKDFPALTKELGVKFFEFISWDR